MMKKYIMLAFSLVTVVSSCGNKNKIPDGILKPDKMQAVMWDFLRADVFTRDFVLKDSSKKAADENLKMQREIFSVHHISKEDFYKSYHYYNLNTRLMKDLLDSMIVQKGREKEKINVKPLKAE